MAMWPMRSPSARAVSQESRRRCKANGSRRPKTRSKVSWEGTPVVHLEEAGEPVAAAPGEGLDLLEGVRAGDDGAQGDDDDVEQAMTLAVPASRVRQVREVASDGQGAGAALQHGPRRE